MSEEWSTAFKGPRMVSIPTAIALDVSCMFVGFTSRHVPGAVTGCSFPLPPPHVLVQARNGLL